MRLCAVDNATCATRLTPCMQEERMDPPPDFGYESYKGSGKLKNKVRALSLFETIAAFLPLDSPDSSAAY